MIILGIICLILGYFIARPLVWVGAALIVIGLVLFIARVPGPIGGGYY